MGSKRKKELFNPLADLLAPAARPAAPKPTVPKRNTKSLDNPLSQLNQSDVRRAIHPEGKDTTMAGRYRRRSILIEPEMDDVINRKSDALEVGKMELVRYLLAVGLAQLNQGNRVPTKQRVVAVKLEMPDWRD